MWAGLLFVIALAVSLIVVIVRSICLEKSGNKFPNSCWCSTAGTARGMQEYESGYNSDIVIHNAPAERAGEEISGVPANAEVITRYSFWDNEMDKFLRGSYPALYQWNTVGDPVGNNINGCHICELQFRDGTRKMVNIMVKADIALSVFNDSEKSKSSEETAKEWIARNRNLLLERYNKGEGFLIESGDLPNDRTAVECILSYMTAGGDFSIHYGPEGIRCVAEY